MKLRFIIILIFGFQLLYGQSDSLLVTKNFEFKDGVYLSFEAFQRNQPAYTWEDLRTNLISNPQTFTAKVQFIRIKENETPLHLDSVWGISLGGLPYVRIEDTSDGSELTNFAALKVRGKICYYEYEAYEEVTVPIKAYNPYTGKPYLESTVKRQKQVMEEWIMDFETGEVLRLNPDNLKLWVREDSQLIEAIESLGEEAWDWDKLFKCILIYDDRHPTYIIQD
jgi:hypothetical protein